MHFALMLFLETYRILNNLPITYKLFETTVNPATDLPMIGAFDSMGNTIDSSARDYYSTSSDYYYSC